MLVDWEEQQNGRRRLRVQPLDGGAIARDILYPMGQTQLLMSATILNSSVFYKSAGLDDSASYIHAPTPFPAKNFGIVYRPMGRMARASMQKTLPNMVSGVRRILRDHPTEKGIIHCSSYEVTRAIGAINDKRLLIQTTAKDREDMLRRHRASKEPTVLVSPSMMEGLDLEGDLGRFQVICKIPFPNMGDPVVSAKNKGGDSWYSWCTARTLIQAIGRCVRGMDDTTHTYILDESFGSFFERWSGLFPEYFAEMDIDV
jgi:Rad3-related DNA helicase